MSNSNGKITAPVKISDVKSVLGETSGNLETLCKSDAINKWSKMKPIISFVKHSMTEDDMKDANYGLSISSVSTFGAMKTASADWPYLKPTSIFRLGDFKGYDHNATSIFEISLGNAEPVQGSITNIITEGLSEIVGMGTFDGFDCVDDLFLGVYVAGIGVYMVTYYNCGIPLYDILDNGHITIPISTDFAVGSTYTLKPFLTTHQYSNCDGWFLPSDDDAGTWWLIPCTGSMDATIKSGSTPETSISFSNESATYTENIVTSISFDVELSAGESAIQVDFKTGPTSYGEYVSIGSISASAGSTSTATIEYTEQIEMNDMSKGIVHIYAYNGNTKIDTLNIEAEEQ